ncbi:MAG: energy-coupled thiamine transporter ThiT [Clostridia bacterium]|nr:energy-coupled thiamine transporter ThiT [Clostridia bacterium]MBR3095200.1 energy-coupled thiamine transporter ThiT [Clostridia bacterium]
MSENKRISSTQKLAECAIMLALAVVLNEFTPIKLPFGGAVTFFSQLPIVVVSYRHGLRWGLLTGLAMGVIEMLFGLENFSYVTGIAAYLILIFADYVIAFSALGLGGVFRKTIKNQALSLAAGGALVSVIRFLCHFISGVTIWGGYAEDTPVAIYSLTYNGSYMLPELIITVIGALVLGSLIDFRSARLRGLNQSKKASSAADAEEPAEDNAE